MKRILFAFFLLCSSLHSWAQPLFGTEPQYPKREARAVWVTTLGGLDWPTAKATSEAGRQKQIAELGILMDKLKDAGINQIILQTRVRASLIYPSTLEPWDIGLTNQAYGRHPGYDPLATAIDMAHQHGMELHAWVVTIPYNKKNNPGSTQAGKAVVPLLVKHDDMYYLNPGLPQTADYLARICREITSRYDVDGIHLDYIRYPENAERFNDAATYKKYAPKGQSKADWRRNNITHIVRTIYNEVKAEKPWVKVSCSPVGKFRDTRRFSSKGWNCYDAVYQDAEGWLKEGIMDALYPMMYFQGDHFYPFVVDWKEHDQGRPVVPGLGIYFLSPKEKNWDFDVIGRELHFLRQMEMGGQAYFRSQFLTDNHKGIYDYLCQTYYAYPALTPAMTWQDSIPPSQPTLVSIENLANEQERIVWHAATDNLQAGGLHYNIYASREWPVDTSRAENLVLCQQSDTTFCYSRLSTQLYGMNFAITAIDRCGNESEPLLLGKPIEQKDFRKILNLTVRKKDNKKSKKKGKK